MKKEKALPLGWMASSKEHLWYGLFFLGQNILWGFAGNIAKYMTDMKIGEFAVASGLVILLPKIWDAINDSLFGYLIDKNRFKNGQKYLPWIRIGVTGISIATILMFALGPFNNVFGQALKITWFIIGYLLFDLFYTLLDAPAFALPTVMTSNIDERNKFVADNKLWSMVGGTLSFLIFMAVYGPFKNLFTAEWAWIIMAVIFCGSGVALMIPLFFHSKERIEPQENQEEKYSLKQMFGYLGKNGNLFIALICLFVFGMTSIETGMAVYLVEVLWPNTAYGTVITAIVSAVIIVASIITPKLTRKYDKFNVLIVSLAISITLGVISYFVGYENPLVACIFVGLKSFGIASWQIVIYMLVSDTTEYGTYRSGTRAAGITFALQTFASKLKGALMTSFILIAIGSIGYVSGTDVVQDPAIADPLWALFIFIPIAGYVISGVLLLLFYNLRDKYVQVMAKYNNGEISYDEACAKLEKKFGKPAVRK